MAVSTPDQWWPATPLRAAILALPTVFSGCATTSPPPATWSQLPEGTAAAEEAGELEHRRHILNGFAGVAQEDAEMEGYALGIDYEYRFSELFGVGAFTEVIAGEGRAVIIGADLVWHAAEPLALFVGYGEERKDNDWEGVMRLGGLYEFPVGDGWTLSPTVAYDFSLKHPDEDVLVFGLSLGYAW
jgi:hypothetical protein